MPIPVSSTQKRERQPSGAIGGSHLQAKGDGSLLRVLDGVVDKVDQHLPEFGGINEDVTGKLAD